MHRSRSHSSNASAKAAAVGKTAVVSCQLSIRMNIGLFRMTDS